jgi:putative hydrolase of the HAD superfamily
MPPIQAITFDLWDTIVHDDSDEPKRSARGLRTKHDERRDLLWRAIDAIEPMDPATVRLAYDVADAAFNRVWKQQAVTWPIEDRIDVILHGLRRSLPDDALRRVIDAHQRMETDIPPDLIDGCDLALAELSNHYKLAIVSDAIVTPGRLLRRLLEVHGVRQYFTGFAFSDEVGRSKPHRAMFAAAAEQLGVPIEAMLHVGDREHNDVRGPHALGMKAILFTATRDVDRATTTADAICERYKDLPGIVAQLASG